MCISETDVTCKLDCLINKWMSLHISIDCFGISINCFGLSRIKKWMILKITVNFSTGIISVLAQHSLLASGISQKRKADSEKTVSSDQSAQKKCKTKSGSGSASNSRVFQPQWLKQFDWLEYASETMRLFCRT